MRNILIINEYQKHKVVAEGKFYVNFMLIRYNL